MTHNIIHFKIKSKSGDFMLQSVFSHYSVGYLKSRVSELTEIPEERLRIMIENPPRFLDLSEVDDTIRSTGLINGDTLIVHEIQNPKDFGKVFSDALEKKKKRDVLDETPSTFSVETGKGTLVRKRVPGDNSCLFTSVNFLINGELDMQVSGMMRQIVAQAIASDPIQYNDALLGLPNRKYCNWILHSDSWGGAIECGVLSKYYGFEIDVVDVENSIILRFGEDCDYLSRGFLLYSGSHYDPLYMPTSNNGPPITMFPLEQVDIYNQALKIGKQLKSALSQRRRTRNE